MVLQKDEYEISRDGKKITLSKEALEKLRDHYNKLSAFKDEVPSYISWLYIGRTDAIVRILKMFEPLEG